MRKNKYLLFLTAVLIGLSMACMPASLAEDMNISLMFSDGTAIQPEAVPGMPDAYWAVVGVNTPKDQVLLRFEEQAGMRYSPKSGSYVSFPDAGSRLSSAAYLPLQCMDAQGNVVRTIRLYVSSTAYVLDSEEETLNLSAVLKEDAPVLDSNGQPHALSGTLAKGTVVRVTGKRESEQGPLCRVELNGELVYLSEAALSFDAPELAMSLDQLFSPENPEDHGFTCSVTTYEAGIRSGKGNTDKNLLGRVSKNTLVFVFSRMSDDDGKLLDLVYCPELGLFGYIHDTQLRILTSEEAESQFTVSTEEEQNTEFQEAAVQTDTRLYSYPDQNSAVITELPRGIAVYAYTRITGAEENWYLAQADDQLGYVPESSLAMTNEKRPASDLLTDLREDQGLKSRYAVVRSSEVLLYDAPSLSASCAGRAAGGEILKVLEEDLTAEGLNWYLVSCGELRGYVLRDQTERLLIGSYLLGGAERGEAGNADE